MKTTIHLEYGGCESARTLIEEALKAVPACWKRLLPDIDIRIVPFNSLPRNARLAWGTKSGIRRNWSIKMIPPKRMCSRLMLKVFMLERKGGEDDYYFKRDMVSAIMACAMTQPHVRDTVEGAAKGLAVGHDALRLVTQEIPSFALQPDVASENSPRLVAFVGRLDQALKSLGNDLDTL